MSADGKADGKEDPGPGTVVAGRYRIDRLIGRGGMGTVWHAVDELLDREVAIKRIRLGTEPGPEDALARERILREARIAARLHHPHIVTIFDVVERDDPWLILEYVPSRSLSSVLTERTRLPPAEVAAIGAQVADALATAHRAGVVHRDVKPDNILIADPSEAGDSPGRHETTVKLADFGISHAVDVPTLTATGVLAGTPAYFAPETAGGEGCDPRSDVYSLGATLYAATEGNPPFGTDTENVLALVARIARGGAPPPQHAGPLTDLLRRLLHDDPAGRPTAGQAHDVLRRLAAMPPDPTAHGGETRSEDGEPTSPLVPAATPASGFRLSRRRVLAAALALAGVAVAGAVTNAAIQPTSGSGSPQATSPPATTAPSAVPATRPATAGAFTISDPRSADPCSLVDLPALEPYGDARITRTNSMFAECRVDMKDAGYLFVELRSAAGAGPLKGSQERLGPLVMARFSSNGTTCTRDLQLADGNIVHITARREGAQDETCTIAETAAVAATNILVERGVGIRIRLDVERALAGVDACNLLQPADLSGIPGLDAAARPGFAGWSCGWGNDGETRVALEFYAGRGLRAAESRPVTFQDRPGAIASQPGAYCAAQIIHDEAVTGQPQRVENSVRVTVYGPQQEAELCGYTTALATTVAGRLPPT